MTLLEFADVLRRNPRTPLKTLTHKAGLNSQKSTQKFLKQLCVSATQGVDPESGRKGVTLYEIALPKSKRRALRSTANGPR